MKTNHEIEEMIREHFDLCNQIDYCDLKAKALDEKRTGLIKQLQKSINDYSGGMHEELAYVLDDSHVAIVRFDEGEVLRQGGITYYPILSKSSLRKEINFYPFYLPDPF